MDKRKIGIIGLGYWGKNLLRNLVELGVIHTACDSNPKIIAERKKDFPGVNYSLDPGDVFKDPRIQAVVISAPASKHYELVKEALRSGKDVFVEKPLALTLGEGQELFEMAGKLKRILMVGHILQYHPAVVKLKEMVSRGELGKIRYIYSNRLNIGKLRVEENILWSFAPHDISVILMLLEEEPRVVSASGGDYLNHGINDVTLTMLEFKNGVKGHVFVSWLHPFKEQKLIVVGSKAMAVFDDMSKEKLFLYPHKIEWKEGKIPVAEKAEHQVIPFEPGEPLKLELEHFIECLETRKTPKTDGAEGLKVLKVLEAAERSLKNPGSTDAAGAELREREYFVHGTSFVDQGATVGKGTQIWHFSHVLKGSVIGEDCRIGQNVVIGPNAKIGDRCKIQNNVSIYDGVELEDAVFCGPSCVFTNVFNPRSEIPRMKELKPTLVKKGATIGANATIVCGNTLGGYSFVGAGSVVTRDVPDHALVFGNPAVLKGWMCECGTKLAFKKDKSVCGACGKEYRREKAKISRRK